MSGLVESRVPAGWVFYSADFSLQSANPKSPGTVMLTRDAEGTREWRALDEPAQMASHLFVHGRGMTIIEALDDAAEKIAKGDSV